LLLDGSNLGTDGKSKKKKSKKCTVSDMDEREDIGADAGKQMACSLSQFLILNHIRIQILSDS